MSINQSRPTINTKVLAEEPKATHKVIFVRMPIAIAERLEYQKQRLSCNMNMLVRMAIVRFLEEAEAEERKFKKIQRDDEDS